ncbi:hypothetical protein FQZ97_877960 [compost metagenome]
MKQLIGPRSALRKAIRTRSVVQALKNTRKSLLQSPTLLRFCVGQSHFRARKKGVRAASSWSIARTRISSISAALPMLPIWYVAAMQRLSTSSISSVMAYLYRRLMHMILRAGRRLSETASRLMSLLIKTILNATMRVLVVAKLCSTRCRGFSTSMVLVCLRQDRRKKRLASVQM